MTHFVCTGECGGISDHAKVCEGENCTKKDHPMNECSCGDEKHISTSKEKKKQDD
jgi:hypothetical protein